MASPNEVLSAIHTLLVLKINHILCGGGGKEEEIGFFMLLFFIFGRIKFF